MSTPTRELIIAHVLATWFNNEADRAYTPEEAEALSIGQIDQPGESISKLVKPGDWEISEGSEYCEWVRIVDGTVVSIADSIGGKW